MVFLLEFSSLGDIMTRLVRGVAISKENCVNSILRK